MLEVHSVAVFQISPLAFVTLAVVFSLAAIVVCLTSKKIERQRMVKAMGGERGDDPVAEHLRLIEQTKNEMADTVTSSKLFELALDALDEGVVIINREGKFLYRNRLAKETSQKAHERSLVEASVNELLTEARDGRILNRELEVFGPPSRMLSLNAFPIYSDTDSGAVGALAVIADVTDAHRIGKTRRDFVANLSHELRTPIGAASLLTEMLESEDDPEVRKQLTGRLLSETERMTNTIDDLLELSRIESETEDYDEEIVIQDLIEEAVARVRVAAEAADIHIGAVMPREPLSILGNRAQLLSAVVNLADNAVKYSAAGDSVSIRTRIQNQDLCLVVQDTGQGIPARDLDRIFERFYRVDHSRDASTGGTGIGLSIVRHVALNHGGQVTVDSVEGDGSIFTLEIPLNTTEEQPDEVSLGGIDGR